MRKAASVAVLSLVCAPLLGLTFVPSTPFAQGAGPKITLGTRPLSTMLQAGR